MNGTLNAAETALVVVDVQNDFVTGALPVPGAKQIIPFINGFSAACRMVGIQTIVTLDWHPTDHCSFVTNGGPWPVHCVADSRGADLANGLWVPPDFIVYKGTESTVEQYSGFFDEGCVSPSINAWLRPTYVKNLLVCGLALDYCVKATVLDAIKHGYKVTVLLDGCRAVGNAQAAVDEMVAAGAVFFS